MVDVPRGEAAGPSREDAKGERVERLVDDLVEWSKVTALEKLGEGERALRIAKGWLWPNVRSPSPLVV